VSDELNMDELWQGGIDKDELAKAQADLLMPIGTYETVPGLTMTFNEEADKFSGRPAGTVAHYFGPVELRVTEKDVAKNPSLTIGDVIAKGSQGFNISPIRVNAKDRTGKDTGRPDRAYRLWMNAVAAYKVAYGAEPSSKLEVLAFVRDYTVRLRIGQYNVPTEDRPDPDGEPGNSVYAISAVKQ